MVTRSLNAFHQMQMCSVHSEHQAPITPKYISAISQRRPGATSTTAENAGAMDSVDYSITVNDLKHRWEWEPIRNDSRFQNLVSAQP